jgi:hypothetical protein
MFNIYRYKHSNGDQIYVVPINSSKINKSTKHKEGKTSIYL